MWLIGLFIGAFVGALGGAAGAFFGALAGAGFGWAMSKNNSEGTRLDRLERTIDYLQQRVTSLERSQLNSSVAEPPSVARERQPAPPVASPEPIETHPQTA